MKYLFPGMLLLGLFSCKVIERKIFSPTPINNPSLKKKDDHSFSLSYSMPSGFDLSGGYAITNHLAVIGGVYAHKNKDREEKYAFLGNPDDNATAALTYRHKGFHAGLGVFFPLSRSKNTFTSFFGGYTQGNFRMDERYFDSQAPPSMPTKINFFKSNISRYFLQGSIITYSDNVEFSFISRYNYVTYANVITDYTLSEQQNYFLPPVGYPKFSQFLDFAFDTKFFLDEHPRLGLQIFASATARLNRRDFNSNFYPFRLGIGLVVKNPFQSHSKK